MIQIAFPLLCINSPFEPKHFIFPNFGYLGFCLYTTPELANQKGAGLLGQGNRFTFNVFSKFGLESPWDSEMIAKLLHSFAFVLINF